MPYGRKHESEADIIGLKFMAEAGYDPREAAELWVRMGKLGGQPPEFLSTHPNPATRVKDINSHMSEILPLYDKSQKQKTVNL
jgi:predicted Zn-dependent protease